jgi:opacity protein-like surface antigen
MDHAVREGPLPATRGAIRHAQPWTGGAVVHYVSDMRRHTCIVALPGALTLLASMPAMALDPAVAAAMALPDTGTTSAPPTTAAAPSSFLGDRLRFIGDVGAAIPQDMDITNVARSGNRTGLSGASLSLDTGIRFDLGLAYDVTEWFNVQLASGLIWNEVSKMQGTVVDGVPSVVGGNARLSGGSGDMYQVPIMVNGEFRLPLGKDMKLTLGGGLGAVWGDLSVSGVNLSTAPAVRASVDGSDWAFAYQGSLGLEWVLSSNVSLGAKYSFLGTTQLDFGTFNYSSPAIRSNGDFTSNVYTHSILATLRIRF